MVLVVVLWVGLFGVGCDSGWLAMFGGLITLDL